MSTQEPVLRLEHVYTSFGDVRVHEDINLEVGRGERLGLVGGSGSGKTTLLREMIGLLPPTSGRIWMFGEPLYERGRDHTVMLRNRCGVLFQAGALFTNLNVYDNVALPLRELRTLDEALVHDLVYLKLRLVGLSPPVARLMPYELSGGMVKRVALARALALEPELLFLDEPTSGLDPVGRDNFARLVGTLHSDLGFTMVLVTHDLQALPALCDRVAVLAEGRLAAAGTLEEVVQSRNETVRALFNAGGGERARASARASDKEAHHA